MTENTRKVDFTSLNILTIILHDQVPYSSVLYSSLLCLTAANSQNFLNLHLDSPSITLQHLCFSVQQIQLLWKPFCCVIRYVMLQCYVCFHS